MALVLGLSTAAFTSALPRFYAGKIPYRDTRAMMMAPVICGTAAAVGWRVLLTNHINSNRLDCPACASIRGAAVGVLCGCTVPSVVVAAVLYHKKVQWVNLRQLSSFAAFCARPYNAARPHLMVMSGLQGVLGYVVASVQFTDQFRRRNSSSSHR